MLIGLLPINPQSLAPLDPIQVLGGVVLVVLVVGAGVVGAGVGLGVGSFVVGRELVVTRRGASEHRVIRDIRDIMIIIFMRVVLVDCG